VEYEKAVDLSSEWPDAVSTLEQSHHGSGWEIGPFVYTGGK
jgi:hypothetical protein